MRDLHARMLAALLAGEGLEGIVELASEEAGTPVAIVLPTRGIAVGSSDDLDLEALSGAAAALVTDGDADAGTGSLPIEAELPIEATGETIGYAFALEARTNSLPRLAIDRKEVLRALALATLTGIAVADARDEVQSEVRSSLVEDLRARRDDSAETLARAARLGCDLSLGAVALVAEVHSAQPRHAAALVAGEHPGALAEALPASKGEGQRLYALLPARTGTEVAERTEASARAIARRLRAHGPAAFSSFCPAPADLGRAIAEAELMLDVIARDERVGEQLTAEIGNGVYRLLFRAMASDPEEVRRFFRDTVEPLVEHDREYRTDLLGTLESYLANDCNMNATARAVFAHRHTVAHRLARVRELTGLDPGVGEDRERLGLGIKAYRIIAPTLHG